MAEMPVYGLVLLGVVGLLVGSFLNVVIVRLPSGGSLVSPPSRCPLCETAIRPVDNIPVLSYALLRGRCRACREPIPLAYPLVEIANAVLWVVAGLRFGTSLALLPYLILFSTLLAQSVIDLELYRLLDKITFPVLGVSIPLIVAISIIEGEPQQIGFALGGCLGYFIFLFVPAFIYPKGMGLGDVKLALLMGLYLGWIQPVLCLFAVITASLLGVVAGLVLWIVRRKSAEFPFGPWLALGCILTIVFSDKVFELYNGSFGVPDFLALIALP